MCWGSTTKAVLHIYYRVENMVILYAGARYQVRVPVSGV